MYKYLMDKNESIIFIDLEADADKKNRASATLIQLAAVKVKENKKIEEMNLCCFKNEIRERISNLIDRPVNYFNNKNFVSEKDAYIKLLNFSNNSKIFSFGNFDNFLLERIYSRNKLKKNNIKFIKTLDLQPKINKSLRMKNVSLTNAAKILNVSIFNNHHDALNDANLLWYVYKKIKGNNINNDEIINRARLIKFLPSLTSREYVNREKINKNIHLNEEYNYVFISILKKDKYEIIKKEKVFEYWPDMEEVEKKYFVTFNIEIIEYNKDLKITNKLSYKVNEPKEDFNLEDHFKKNEIYSIIKWNLNNLFIVNSKTILNYYSTIFKQQLFTIQDNNVINKMSNIEEVKKIKKFVQESIDKFR